VKLLLSLRGAAGPEANQSRLWQFECPSTYKVAAATLSTKSCFNVAALTGWDYLAAAGFNDPRYAATAMMSSSVIWVTGFFISGASPPFRVPSLN
jgi:hypothetical protein